MANQVQKSLKIIFLTNWYPRSANPVEGIFIQELARAISKFHTVIVIHNQGADPGLENPWRLYLEENSSLTRGIKTYRFRYRPSSLPKTNLPLSNWYLTKAFRRIVKTEGNPDLIHAHVYTAGFLGVIVGRIMRIPVVITEHSSTFSRGLLSRSGRWMAWIAFRLAEAVIPVSSALKESITKVGLTGNFQIIPNVVDDELFYFKAKDRSKDQLRFLYVGLLDLSGNKGLPILFQALEMYLANNTNWQLDILGDGPGKEKLQAQVNDSQLVGYVNFHGLKSKSEVASYMHKSDVFILPSIKETFSVVTAEALATGTPVLATKCGGPEDFVDQTNGVLVEVNDPQALYQGLLELVGSLATYDKAKISWEANQKFSLKVIGEAYTKIYKRVLFS